MNLAAWQWAPVLDQQIEALPKRSAQRTRLRLIRGAAQLMADTDKPLRPAAINRAAHTGQGTFYLHFADAAEAEQAVVAEVLQYRAGKLPVLQAQDDAFAALRGLIDAYAKVYAANAALFRGIMDRVNHDPDLAQVRNGYNLAIIDNIKADLRRRGTSPRLSDNTLELSIWIAGTMMEDTLYATLASGRSPHGLELAGGLHGLVDVLSVMFYRALYAPQTPGLDAQHKADLNLLGTWPEMAAAG